MKIPLPKYYFEWIESIGETYCVEHAERQWFISTIQEMSKEIKIDKFVTPSWQQLKSFANTYHQVTKASATTDQNGNEFALKRLTECIVIGDDNGDPLFCDPSDSYSVWCYYPSGGDVQKLSDSLEKFISGSEAIRD